MLVQDAMQKTPQQAPQEAPQEEAQAAPQEESAEFGQEATPEEQQAYEKVILAASEVLYDPKTSPKVIQMLQAGAEQPDKAIANAAVLVMTQLDDQSGGTIPEEVILPAATEVAELVAELGQKQGIFQVDDAVLKKAGHAMLMSLAEQYEIDPAELQPLLESMPKEELDRMYQEQNVYGEQA